MHLRYSRLLKLSVKHITFLNPIARTTRKINRKPNNSIPHRENVFRNACFPSAKIKIQNKKYELIYKQNIYLRISYVVVRYQIRQTISLKKISNVLFETKEIDDVLAHCPLNSLVPFRSHYQLLVYKCRSTGCCLQNE